MPLTTLQCPKMYLAARSAFILGLRRVTTRPAALNNRSNEADDAGTPNTCCATVAKCGNSPLRADHHCNGHSTLQGLDLYTSISCATNLLIGFKRGGGLHWRTLIQFLCDLLILPRCQQSQPLPGRAHTWACCRHSCTRFLFLQFCLVVLPISARQSHPLCCSRSPLWRSLLGQSSQWGVDWIRSPHLHHLHNIRVGLCTLDGQSGNLVLNS